MDISSGKDVATKVKVPRSAVKSETKQSSKPQLVEQNESNANLSVLPKAFSPNSESENDLVKLWVSNLKARVERFAKASNGNSHSMAEVPIFISVNKFGGLHSYSFANGERSEATDIASAAILGASPFGAPPPGVEPGVAIRIVLSIPINQMVPAASTPQIPAGSNFPPQTSEDNLTKQIAAAQDEINRSDFEGALSRLGGLSQDQASDLRVKKLIEQAKAGQLAYQQSRQAAMIYSQGLDAYRKGDYDQALKSFEIARKLNPIDSNITKAIDTVRAAQAQAVKNLQIN
jgi:hypothetical protein